MRTPLWHPRTHQRVFATNAEELAAYTAEGYSSRPPQVRFVDQRGLLSLRSATQEEAELGRVVSGGQFVAASDEGDEFLEGQAHREGIALDAQNLGVRARVALSVAASDATAGLTTLMGTDIREGLSDEDRGTLRENTAGAEMTGHVGAVALPGSAVGRGAQAVAGSARWLPRAMQLGVEGAIGGAAATLSEAAVENDPEILAERLGADMGLGGVIGLGLGAAGSAGGRLLRRIRPNRGNALRQGVDAVEDGLSSHLEQTTARYAESGNTSSFRQHEGGAISQRIHRLENGVDARDPNFIRARNNASTNAPRLMGNFVDTAEDARRAMREVLETGSRAQSLDNVVVDGMTAEARGVATSRTAALLDAFELVDNLPQSTRALSRELRDTLSRLEDMPTRPAEVLQRVHSVQEQVEDIVARSQSLPEGSIAHQEMQMAQQTLYDIPRDASFGEAGSVLTHQRDALNNMRRLRAKLSGKMRRTSDGFDPSGLDDNALFSRETLEREFKRAASTGNREVLDTFEEIAGEMRSLSESPLRNQLPDNFVARSEAIVDNVQQSRPHLEAVFQDARKVATENAGAQGLQATRQMAGGFGIGAGILGGPAAGVGAAGVAIAAGAARAPYQIGRMLSGIRSSFGSQTTRLGGALEGMGQAIRSTSRFPFSGTITAPAASIAALAVNGSREDRVEGYEAIAAQLEAVMGNPKVIASLAAQATPVSDEVDPRLPMQMGMQQSRQIAVLAGALPRSRRSRGGSLGSPRGMTPPPMPSMVEVNEFLQVASVVEDPIFGVELMRSGRLGTAAARAIPAAFPRFHQQVSARLLAEVAQSRQRGQRINYQAGLMMSRFLGYPIDDTMRPDFQAAMADQSAQTPAQESAQFSRAVSTREPSMLRNEQTVTSRIQS